MKRYVIEFGMGIDLHGQDINKAAIKAINDAVSRACLCGLSEIFGIEDYKKDVLIKLNLAVSAPEKIDETRVLAALPMGTAELTVTKGGMRAPGLLVPSLGDKNDSVEVAIAVLEVCIRKELLEKILR